MRVGHISARFRRLAIYAVLVSTGIAAGISGASGHSSLSKKVASRRSSVAHAASVPSQLLSAYSIFRQGGKASGALPVAWAANGLGSQYGLNPSLARHAGSAGSAAVWLVPGDSGSCVVLADGGSACGPNALVAQQGIFVGVVPTSGAASSVVGVVPDGAHVMATDSAGSKRMLGLSGNVFAVTSAGNVVGFTVSEPNGSLQSVTLPAQAPSSLTPPSSG